MEVIEPSLDNLSEKCTVTLTYPQILQYQDYRLYLQDMYAFKHSVRPTFSFRQFSQQVGLKSPNYLQLVIQGKRNLTETTGDRVADVLKISKGEKDYFRNLIRIDNATNDEEKREANKALLISAKKLLAKNIELNQGHILSKWYYLLVRELVTFPDFRVDGEYIAGHLQNLITVEEAEEALTFLTKNGFLVEKSGKLEQAEPVLATNCEVFQHQFMQKYHAQHLKLWAQHIEDFSSNEQELGIINIPISSDKIPILRQKIREFQDEIVGLVQSEKNPDRLIQLGTYLIPFAKRK